MALHHPGDRHAKPGQRDHAPKTGVVINAHRHGDVQSDLDREVVAAKDEG